MAIIITCLLFGELSNPSGQEKKTLVQKESEMIILSKVVFSHNRKKTSQKYLLDTSWLGKHSTELLRLLLSQQCTWEVKETALTSAVRKQDTWTHKYPPFGSIYRQINIYFYRSKHRSQETLSLFLKQDTVLNSIINIQVNVIDSVTLLRKSTKVCSSLEY